MAGASSSGPGGDRSSLGRELAVVGAYTLMAALMTYPLVLHFSGAVPGDPHDPGDYWAYYWDLWWIKKALLELHVSPYFTPYVHHPQGSVLYFHSLMLLPGLLALPVVAVFGLTVGYNFVVALAFVGSGYGAYRLVHYLLEPAGGPDHERALAAFLGGMVFTFNGYHLTRLLGHLDLVSLQWLPLYVLFLLRSWREEGWRNPALAGLFLWATALTNWYYAAFLALFTLLFLAHQAVFDRAGDFLMPLRRVLAALAACAVAVSPVVVPMLRLGRSMGHLPDAIGDAKRYSADLLAFVTPSPMHSLWGALAGELHAALEGEKGNLAESVVFLGLIPLLLSGVALAASLRRQRLWVLAFTLFTVLALGPELRVGGHVVALAGRALPMPYALLMRLPYGDLAHAPARFAAMSTLCLAVLSGQGWLLLMRRLRAAKERLALAVLACGCILLENAMIPYPLAPVVVPAAYDAIGRDSRPLAVLEVPIPENPALYPQRMLYQTHHGKPLFGGYLSRGLPPLPFEALPGFRELKALSLDVPEIVFYGEAERSAIARESLRSFGAGYVVLLKADLADGASGGVSGLARAQAVAGALFDGATPAFDDAEVRAYAVPTAPGPAFLYLGEGWSYLEAPASGPANPAPHWRWMAEAAAVGFVAPRPGSWRLELNGWSWQRPRRIEVLVDGRSASTLVIRPEREAHETPEVAFAAGLHRVELRSLDGADAAGGADTRRLSVAFSEIRLRP